MVKRIIFDQDNTLMMWKDEYDESYKKALDELNISYSDSDINDLINIIDNYEKYYDMYNKKNMVNLINEKCRLKVPNNFVDVWMKYLCNCYSEDDKKNVDVLEYLSSKYELVVLSNWFRYSQVKRIENAGLDKYFIDMIFTDTVKNKPNKEAFIKACGSHQPSECIMIGDNYNVDILGAINAGLDAILLDKYNKSDYKNKIKDISELEELL